MLAYIDGRCRVLPQHSLRASLSDSSPETPGECENSHRVDAGTLGSGENVFLMLPAPAQERRARPPEPEPARAGRDARRRRVQLIRRRRRDLLEDIGLAMVLAIFVLSVTAGLGIVAILEVPAIGLLLGSVIVERRRRQRRADRRMPARSARRLR